ncbi:2-dehydro-3-deoxygalactonokinase, partial [Pengzhenrongella sp.]|uniref:2-dehydro-3-deoxygalactonokinase n=1 Tax=Pengzhenrongella sp. TaxID=2888820 RepID=UPI002F94D540
SHPGLPVIACGMVGSNHGWAQAEYRTLPADLAAADVVLTPVRTAAGTAAGTIAHIIPGLLASAGLPGVMRGEETQVLGALCGELAAGTFDRSAERLVLLPGTHSKWVQVTGTTVTGFSTWMTGEIYALLTADSTLARMAKPADRPDWAAFERGLDVAASPVGRGGILNTAFSARTLVLTGQLAPEQVEDYLSGLLIGHELTGVAASWKGREHGSGQNNELTGGLKGAPPVLLCGEENLNARYRRALERRGIQIAGAVTHSAPAGMWLVAQATGLLERLTNEAVS